MTKCSRKGRIPGYPVVLGTCNSSVPQRFPHVNNTRKTVAQKMHGKASAASCDITSLNQLFMNGSEVFHSQEE